MSNIKTEYIGARVTPETKQKLQSYGLTVAFIIETIIQDKELLNLLLDKKQEQYQQAIEEKRKLINQELN